MLARFLLAVATFLLVQAGPAWSCSCWHPSAEEYFKAADTIASGTVANVIGTVAGADGGFAAEIEVETHYKGAVRQRIWVSSYWGDGANCGWGFAPGQKVMLFAVYKSYLGQRTGPLSTNMCMMIPYTAAAQRAHYDPFLADYRRRVAELNRAVAADPRNPAPRADLARYLAEWTDNERALDAWNSAAALAPDDSEIILGRGLALFAVQDFVEARRDLERALRQLPDRPDAQAKLIEARLKSGDLAQAAATDFQDAKLYNLRLPGLTSPGRNFTGAELYGSEFIGANLAGSDFSRARLDSADLSFADLRGINFDRGRAYYGKMREANLAEAKLSGADLAWATFNGANLSRIQAVNTRFSVADFSGANLTHANLTSARFDNANFAGADLTGISFDRANFVGARYDCRTRFPQGFGPRAQQMLLVSPSCDGQATRRDFSGFHIRYLYLQGCDFSGASFRDATLDGVSFTDCNLAGADFSGATISGTFRGSNLRGANFSNAKLKVAFFGVGELGSPGARAADLKDARFDGAHLRRADFAPKRPAIFRPGMPRLEDVDLRAVDFMGAIVE